MATHALQKEQAQQDTDRRRALQMEMRALIESVTLPSLDNDFLSDDAPNVAFASLTLSYDDPDVEKDFVVFQQATRAPSIIYCVISPVVVIYTALVGLQESVFVWTLDLAIVAISAVCMLAMLLLRHHNNAIPSLDSAASRKNALLQEKIVCVAYATSFLLPLRELAAKRWCVYASGPEEKQTSCYDGIQFESLVLAMLYASMVLPHRVFLFTPIMFVAGCVLFHAVLFIPATNENEASEVIGARAMWIVITILLAMAANISLEKQSRANFNKIQELTRVQGASESIKSMIEHIMSSLDRHVPWQHAMRDAEPDAAVGVLRLRRYPHRALNVGPMQVVADLQPLVLALDSVVAQYRGLVKVGSFGDEYMVVSGVHLRGGVGAAENPLRADSPRRGGGTTPNACLDLLSFLSEAFERVRGLGVLCEQDALSVLCAAADGPGPVALVPVGEARHLVALGDMVRQVRSAAMADHRGSELRVTESIWETAGLDPGRGPRRFTVPLGCSDDNAQAPELHVLVVPSFEGSDNSCDRTSSPSTANTALFGSPSGSMELDPDPTPEEPLDDAFALDIHGLSLAFRSRAVEQAFDEDLSNFTVLRTSGFFAYAGVVDIATIATCVIAGNTGFGVTAPLPWLLAALGASTIPLVLLLGGLIGPHRTGLITFLQFLFFALYDAALAMQQSGNLVGNSPLLWCIVLEGLSFSRSLWSTPWLMWLLDILVLLPEALSICLQTISTARKTAYLDIVVGLLLYVALFRYVADYMLRVRFRTWKQLEAANARLQENNRTLAALLDKMMPVTAALSILHRINQRSNLTRVHPLKGGTFTSRLETTALLALELHFNATAPVVEQIASQRRAFGALDRDAAEWPDIRRVKYVGDVMQVVSSRAACEATTVLLQYALWVQQALAALAEPVGPGRWRDPGDERGGIRVLRRRSGPVRGASARDAPFWYRHDRTRDRKHYR
jgi:hypothetical protein